MNGNDVQRWMLALGIMAASLVVAGLVYTIIFKVFRKWSKRTRTGVDDIMVRKVRLPLVYGILLLGVRLSFQVLYLPDSVRNNVHKAFVLLFVLLVTWFISRLVNGLLAQFDEARESDTGQNGQRFSPVFKRLLAIVIWTIGLITGLNNAGFDVAALLAGLGIGGLALALASQDTVKNMIGGLIIILDKPFGIGDYVKVDNYEGQVEDIGLRSTRLRNTDGKQVSIPNTLFSDKPILNITREENRIVQTTLLLSYHNEKFNIEKARETILVMLNNQPELMSEHNSVLVVNLSFRGIEMKVSYKIRAGQTYLAIQSRINILLLDELAKNNVKMLVTEG